MKGTNVGMDRHLLGLRNMSADEIRAILDRAAYWEQASRRSDLLDGRFVANLFFEKSTRTRFSFEIAERRLGAIPLSFSAEESSVRKGESVYDTLKTFGALGADAAVVRLASGGVLAEIAGRIAYPIVNAGDGVNEHPTQALLDIYTMRKHFGEIRGLTVAIIGDVRHSRVARSNLWGLTKLGAKVRFCAPPNMRADELAEFAEYVTMEEALRADVVMALRVQFERHEGRLVQSPAEYRAAYGLTEERVAAMAPHAIVMHPGPVNRNVEIDDAVVEHPRSKIFAQMAAGVPVRMAVLERALAW